MPVPTFRKHASASGDATRTLGETTTWSKSCSADILLETLQDTKKAGADWKGCIYQLVLICQDLTEAVTHQHCLVVTRRLGFRLPIAALPPVVQKGIARTRPIGMPDKAAANKRVREARIACKEASAGELVKEGVHQICV